MSNKSIEVHPMITMTLAWKWKDILAGISLHSLATWRTVYWMESSIVPTEITTIKVHVTIGGLFDLSR
jgi:hypothetical protein